MQINCCFLTLSLFVLARSAPLVTSDGTGLETREPKDKEPGEKSSKFDRFSGVLGVGASGAIILNTIHSILGDHKSAPHSDNATALTTALSQHKRDIGVSRDAIMNAIHAMFGDHKSAPQGDNPKDMATALAPHKRDVVDSAHEPEEDKPNGELGVPVLGSTNPLNAAFRAALRANHMGLL